MHVKVLSTQEVMSYPGFDELIEEYSRAFDNSQTGSVKVDWKAYEDFGDNLKTAAVIAEGKIVGIAAVLTQRSRHYDMVKVDWKAYEDFGDNLKTAAVIAEGKIVGIAAVLTQRSRHYDMSVVTIEALYLRRAYRKGTAGLRLLWAASDIARDSGAKGLALCAPPESELSVMRAARE